jgi:hypothetical protein
LLEEEFANNLRGIRVEMSHQEADDPSRPADDAGPTGKAETEPGGEPAAWPPREAAPVEDAAPAAATVEAKAEPQAPDAKKVATPDPAAPQPEADRGGGSMPAEEMGFSDSTLHWLADGDVSAPVRASGPVTLPSFDPRAPVAGQRRAILVVGGAGIVALAIAGGFFIKAEQRRAAELPAAVRVEPARDLTTRAEAAFAANRVPEALDLARLALVADGRFADAHFLVAECERARGQTAPARDAYRKYLDLAPLGKHAAAARAALTALQ